MIFELPAEKSCECFNEIISNSIDFQDTLQQLISSTSVGNYSGQIYPNELYSEDL